MHLTMLAKPVCDRNIFKLIRKNKFRSIIEVGMTDGTRCENMMRVAQKYGVSTNVRYTGVDHFEARTEGKPLQLIEMHRKLKAYDAKTQLVPGDIGSAVSRIANSHVRTDLIVISAGYDQDALESSWFYFPRMLHSRSLVLIQESAGSEFKTLTRLDVERLAEKRTPKTAAAA